MTNKIPDNFLANPWYTQRDLNIGIGNRMCYTLLYGGLEQHFLLFLYCFCMSIKCYPLVQSELFHIFLREHIHDLFSRERIVTLSIDSVVFCVVNRIVAAH